MPGEFLALPKVKEMFACFIIIYSNHTIFLLQGLALLPSAAASYTSSLSFGPVLSLSPVSFLFPSLLKKGEVGWDNGEKGKKNNLGFLSSLPSSPPSN